MKRGSSIGRAATKTIPPRLSSPKAVRYSRITRPPIDARWLEDELEGYWVAPADTPAFRRGIAVASEKFTTRRASADQVAETDQHENYQQNAPAVAAGLYLVPKGIE